MQNKLNITFITLVVLTITTALLSNNHKVAFGFIITIALVKFWMVAFNFMELKIAHVFWKSLIVIWGVVMGLIIIVLT